MPRHTASQQSPVRFSVRCCFAFLLFRSRSISSCVKTGAPEEKFSVHNKEGREKKKMTEIHRCFCGARRLELLGQLLRRRSGSLDLGRSRHVFSRSAPYTRTPHAHSQSISQSGTRSGSRRDELEHDEAARATSERTGSQGAAFLPVAAVVYRRMCTSSGASRSSCRETAATAKIRDSPRST